MAFILRRPFALSATLKQISKSTSTTTRALHNSPLKRTLLPCQTSSATPSFLKTRNAFQSSSRRNYMQQSYEVSQPNSGNLTQKLLYGAGIVGATVIATNLIFNRETREDGGMPDFERHYLNDTFMHTGLGIGIIGVAAQALHRSGWSYRLMAANPWLVIGGGLAMSIGTMYGCFATSPDKCVIKCPQMIEWVS